MHKSVIHFPVLETWMMTASRLFECVQRKAEREACVFFCFELRFQIKPARLCPFVHPLTGPASWTPRIESMRAGNRRTMSCALSPRQAAVPNSVCVWLCVVVCGCVCAHAEANTFTHSDARTRTRTRTRTHTHAHAHAHAHARTRTHTHTHTPTLAHVLAGRLCGRRTPEVA